MKGWQSLKPLVVCFGHWLFRTVLRMASNVPLIFWSRNLSKETRSLSILSTLSILSILSLRRHAHTLSRLSLSLASLDTLSLSLSLFLSLETLEFSLSHSRLTRLSIFSNSRDYGDCLETLSRLSLSRHSREALETLDTFDTFFLEILDSRYFLSRVAFRFFSFVSSFLPLFL